GHLGRLGVGLKRLSPREAIMTERRALTRFLGPCPCTVGLCGLLGDSGVPQHRLGRRLHRQASPSREMGPRMIARILLHSLVMLLAFPHGAFAGEPLTEQEPMACRVDEPDSVQINWDTPCLQGTWLLDTELGCRMWDWHPTPEDTATWSGACRGGAKAGG